MKTAQLGIRVSPDVKEALARAAKTQRRSSASMLESILYGWLHENGFLQDAAQIAVVEVTAQNFQMTIHRLQRNG
jgi:hypothetical protein